MNSLASELLLASQLPVTGQSARFAVNCWIEWLRGRAWCLNFLIPKEFSNLVHKRGGLTVRGRQRSLKMNTRWIACSLLPLFACSLAFGQSGSLNNESYKYRTIFTLAGGGGGFAVGVFAGLAAFDDATNSDRKVWTTAALSAVGGAVGGYFLGRVLDKRQKKATVTWKRDDVRLSLMPTPGPNRQVSGSARQPVNLRAPQHSPAASDASIHHVPSAGYRLPDVAELYLVTSLERMESGADGFSVRAPN